MEKATFEIINPKSLYDATTYGYSHIAHITGQFQLVFVAGQGGENQEGYLEKDFRSQVRQAFHNIKTALDEVGLTVNDIAKLTTLIVDYDAEKHQILNEESERLWPARNFPTQTLIPVTKLALEIMLFEVEAIAVKA